MEGAGREYLYILGLLKKAVLDQTKPGLKRLCADDPRNATPDGRCIHCRVQGDGDSEDVDLEGLLRTAALVGLINSMGTVASSHLTINSARLQKQSQSLAALAHDCYLEMVFPKLGNRSEDFLKGRDNEPDTLSGLDPPVQKEHLFRSGVFQDDALRCDGEGLGYPSQLLVDDDDPWREGQVEAGSDGRPWKAFHLGRLLESDDVPEGQQPEQKLYREGDDPPSGFEPVDHYSFPELVSLYQNERPDEEFSRFHLNPGVLHSGTLKYNKDIKFMQNNNRGNKNTISYTHDEMECECVDELERFLSLQYSEIGVDA
uniref:Wsv133-like protein n=1 Tax=Sicyonia whispovirus TaxID=2984283 RepID=A0A9C7F8G5_9VIRU|nr:MAG: wsv133-like protein [Sicyonia whispovirus]